MSRKLSQIRNIGIIAHIDAGKTTVTEGMLFLSGAKHRVGKVDSGTTTTDDDVEEQNRGITIYAACVTFDWKEIHINLLDTPGHVDFTAEVERSLRVLDGAVVVFSAREGVEAQSETVWRQANKYHVPRICFINKLDREGADFERVVRDIGRRLQGNPVVIQIPVGQGPAHVNDPFRGVIDLIEQKFLTFSDDGKTVTAAAIPDALLDLAEIAREELLENLYSYNDAMMELAMAGESIPADLIRSVLRQATLAELIQPVICGAALQGINVSSVLDAVQFYLPSPEDRPPVIGFQPENPQKALARKPDPHEPFCGLVFKILPAKTGDFYWVRVYSGELRENSRVLCPSKDKKENVAQLWQIFATRKTRDGQIPRVAAGDIVGVIGPRDAITGDTFCDPKSPIQLESIEFPPTVIEMAIEPESTAERKKLNETLEMLKRQDPTFNAKENPETGQTLIAGMGELHLEIIKNRLLRDFNLNVKVHKPRVSYRETILQAATVTGECHRVVAGQQLFAKITIRMEPFEPAAQDVRVSNQAAGTINPEWGQIAIEELRNCSQAGGPIGSFPLAKIKVSLVGGEFNEATNEVAIRIASADAFEKGLAAAGSVLLEPIMKLTITTPDEFYGDFVGDLAQRRAKIVHTDNLGEITLIEAHAPLAALFGYSNSMRSLSQGRAGSSMEPLEYAAAPRDVVESFGAL